AKSWPVGTWDRPRHHPDHLRRRQAPRSRPLARSGRQGVQERGDHRGRWHPGRHRRYRQHRRRVDDGSGGWQCDRRAGGRREREARAPGRRGL
ncbi:MAG: Twin-arginine translocation protein TatA, partial [uncultured Thermomicrobiales bacterium]